MFSKVYIVKDIIPKDSDTCRVIAMDNGFFGSSLSSADTLGTSAVIGSRLFSSGDVQGNSVVIGHIT